MKKKSHRVSNFGQNQTITSDIYRPERQSAVSALLQNRPSDKPLLARGKGLSYGDVCLNETLVSTERLDRLLAFKKDTNELIVEPGVTFSDLMTIEEHSIPPVIPGTVHASIGGGVANDVHGKNNVTMGALGSHINWLELALPKDTVRVSKTHCPDLFYATIGGLGLTGFIKKISLTMQTHSRRLKVNRICFNDIFQCLNLLQAKAAQNDYTAAWCDFYHQGRGILFVGNHILANAKKEKERQFNIPFTPPISLVNKFSMRLFNQYYYHRCLNNPTTLKQNLDVFNNPLDSVKHFNRVYGPKGFYQVQCVVPFEYINDFSEQCLNLFKKNHTYPTLCVVKVLGKKGLGLLSFTQPGITFAFDFSRRDKRLIQSLFSLLIECNGRVYLAKDSLLDKSLFKLMYPNHESFIEVLQRYDVYQHFQSTMSRRLGIH